MHIVAWVQSFGEFLWLSFLLLSPMLLLGLFLSGLFHVFISREAVLRWFRDDSLNSTSTAALIGVPMPLCSCSVVPVVAEMRRKGASRSACISFLITAPETGADSILVTNAFFGWIPAIFRPFVSYVTAVVAGIFCIGLIRQDPDNSDAKETHTHGHSHNGNGHDHDHEHEEHQKLNPDADDCYISLPTIKDLLVERVKELGTTIASWRLVSWLKPDFYLERLRKDEEAERTVRSRVEGDAERPAMPSFQTVVRHIFRYGFVEIADDILFALLVGIVLGGMIYLAVPTDLLEHEYARWISYPVMVLVGVPLYICASASTPIAAALVVKGFSPGAALIFLMTGPATNTGTVAIIVSQFGARFATVYVGSVVVVTVLIGILLDLVLIWTGFEIMANLQKSENVVIEFTQIVSAVVLFALIVWRFRAGALKSGYEDMMINIKPAFRPLSRFWKNLARGRGVKGTIALRNPLGWLILLVTLSIFGLSGFTTIPPGHLGYGKLLGKVVWRDLEPGLHYLAPMPFVMVDKWPAREIKTVRGHKELETEYLTGDLNLVHVQTSVQYQVSDPYRYHYFTFDAPHAISKVIQECVRIFIGARDLESLLNVNRRALESFIRTQFELPKHQPLLGSIDLVKANLLYVGPTPETFPAFREVSSAQEDRERIIVNGQRFLVSLTPRANGNSFYEVKVAESGSYRRVQTATAEADALKQIASAVETSPEIIQYMLWREKLETALSGKTKIIVPSQAALDKIALWKAQPGRSNQISSHHDAGK